MARPESHRKTRRDRHLCGVDGLRLAHQLPHNRIRRHLAPRRNLARAQVKGAHSVTILYTISSHRISDRRTQRKKVKRCHLVRTPGGHDSQEPCRHHTRLASLALTAIDAAMTSANRRRGTIGTLGFASRRMPTGEWTAWRLSHLSVDRQLTEEPAVLSRSSRTRSQQVLQDGRSWHDRSTAKRKAVSLPFVFDAPQPVPTKRKQNSASVVRLPSWLEVIVRTADGSLHRLAQGLGRNQLTGPSRRQGPYPAHAPRLRSHASSRQVRGVFAPHVVFLDGTHGGE